MNVPIEMQTTIVRGTFRERCRCASSRGSERAMSVYRAFLETSTIVDHRKGDVMAISRQCLHTSRKGHGVFVFVNFQCELEANALSSSEG